VVRLRLSLHPQDQELVFKGIFYLMYGIIIFASIANLFYGLAIYFERHFPHLLEPDQCCILNTPYY
jgi:hypothetical protein